eukprot:738665-Alexandrium_andersonii.AAC.1
MISNPRPRPQVQQREAVGRARTLREVAPIPGPNPRGNLHRLSTRACCRRRASRSTSSTRD